MASITEVMGRDLRHESDFVVRTDAKDLDTVEGLENLRRAVIRRIVTQPGTVIHRPEYGAGLLNYQGAPMTLANQRAIAARISDQLRRDPRIQDVIAVGFDVPDGNPSMLNIRVRYTVIGYGEDTVQFVPFGGVI